MFAENFVRFGENLVVVVTRKEPTTGQKNHRHSDKLLAPLCAAKQKVLLTNPGHPWRRDRRRPNPVIRCSLRVRKEKRTSQLQAWGWLKLKKRWSPRWIGVRAEPLPREGKFKFGRAKFRKCQLPRGDLGSRWEGDPKWTAPYHPRGPKWTTLEVQNESWRGSLHGS